MYNGYIESDEHVEWRMNRRRLQNIEAIYGENWEQDADSVHAFIAAAESTDKPFEDAWCWEEEMTARHADALDEERTVREAVG